MTSTRSNIAATQPDEKSTNVRVVIRVRPENSREAASASRNIIEVLDDNILIFDPKEQTSPQFYHGRRIRRRNILVRRNKDLRFGFDHVFDRNASQQSVYEMTTKPVLDGLMDGYNCSVFAYGATGAGKTFTMLGNGSENPGVIFLTMMELYQRIEQVQSEKICDVAVSYLEVYNETIRDLLVPSGPLAVREDPQKGVCVSGLSVHKPQSAEELFSMLQFGNKNRTQHPTDANAESSRSHAVFQVFVRQKNRTASLNADVKIGKMSLIDLAGSERALVTRNRGARFQEGANINKSLLALGSCINALASNKKDQFVPYRNSKLTRLLKDSLGGNCNTVMIAAVSPSSLTYDDTYNTLRYADRAKNIRTQAKSNVVNVNFHVTQYTKIISDLRLEISELKQTLSQQSTNGCKDKSKTDTKVLVPGYQLIDAEKIHKYNSILYDVFTQRASIRRELMELESSDRDLCWKILQKNLTIERIRMVYGNQVEGEKTMSKFQRTVAASEARHARVKKRKVDVDSRMEENEDWLQNTVTEMTSLCNGNRVPEVLQLTLRTRHLEIEVKDLRRQVKHLTKFARQQDSYMHSSERLISTLLHTVRKQFYLLKGSNIATSEIITQFENIQKQVEGDREVIWADQYTPELESSSDVNRLLELPVLNCVRTTPDAPSSDSYAKAVTDSNKFGTPCRLNTGGNQHSAARQIITDTTTTQSQQQAAQSSKTDFEQGLETASTCNRRRTFTTEPQVIKKALNMGTPMRVCASQQSTDRTQTNELPTDYCTIAAQDSTNKASPFDKNGSFTIEGIRPLSSTPSCTSKTDSLNTHTGKFAHINAGPLSYAKVASTPKRESVVSRRLPLTNIDVNSPQPSNQIKPFQQKQRKRKPGSDDSAASAVRSLGLPSMSDRIQGKKRPAPAYMMLTTAAKNKRADTQRTRTSSEHRTPFAALPSRVRNIRAAPSRNVKMARTKSMNSLRSTWQL